MSNLFRITIDEIMIYADPDAVFNAAAHIESWPKLLPHYRWIKFLDVREVEMSARRGRIPVKWTAIRKLDRHAGRVYYEHTGGLTKGMLVEWAIDHQQSGARVRITHDLRLQVPVVRSLVGRWIVSRFFIKHIAGKTLRHIKETVEKEAECACAVRS